MRCGHCKGRHATVAQVRLCSQREWERRAEEAEAQADADAERATELRYERWLEDGGAHSEVIAWEHEQDRLRAPFDPQN